MLFLLFWQSIVLDVIVSHTTSIPPSPLHFLFLFRAGMLLSLWFPPCVAITVGNYLLGQHVVSTDLQKCMVVVGISISFFFYPGMSGN